MKKSTYIFICLLLSVRFWQFSFLPDFLAPDFILVFTWLWALFAYLMYRRKPRLNTLNSFKYKKIMYLIFLGIFISMLSAQFFWQQNFITTLIAQRGIYSFILLPAILYVQPNEDEIFKALKWISLGVILVWIISIINPTLIGSIDPNAIALKQNNKNATDLGFYVSGYRFVILYLYFILYKLSKQYSKKFLFSSLLLFLFIILFQNRSMLIGAIMAFAIVLWNLNSKNKFIIYSVLTIVIIGIISWTANIWTSLWDETIEQLSNTDYNRWKAFYYYLFDYSPNWFCYVFGNGFPSGGNSPLGDLMWSNFKLGIYASDLGMIGMWTDYGVIPIILIYTIVLSILIKKEYPLYLKFISLHLCIVPTIFHFWDRDGLLIIIIIIYLFAYHTEYNKIQLNALYNNR